jgi:hypothetical protein
MVNIRRWTLDDGRWNGPKHTANNYVQNLGITAGRCAQNLHKLAIFRGVINLCTFCKLVVRRFMHIIFVQLPSVDVRFLTLSTVPIKTTTYKKIKRSIVIV